MWGKRDGKHRSDRASRANHELSNRDWSILFHSCSGQMKYCKVQHQQLTLAQFVPLPMHGWNWPVFEMFRIPGTWLSRHTRITAINVCDSRFDKHWHGAKSSPSLFQCQLCCNEVQERCPYLSCLQNLDLTLKVKAESKMAYSFEDAARSNPRVEPLLHCCFKLDVRKGGGSKGSPTIEKHVKTMRWWVLAENLKAFVSTWRYPGGRSDSDIPAVLQIAE